MADLRDDEQRDDTSHGSVIAQLRQATDDELEDAGIDPDDLPDDDEEASDD